MWQKWSWHGFRILWQCQLQGTRKSRTASYREMRPAYISSYRRLQLWRWLPNLLMRTSTDGCTRMFCGRWLKLKGWISLIRLVVMPRHYLHVDELAEIPRSQWPVEMSSQLLPKSSGDSLTNPQTYGSTLDEFQGLLNDCCIHRDPFHSGFVEGNGNHHKWAMCAHFVTLSVRLKFHSYWHRTIRRLR